MKPKILFISTFYGKPLGGAEESIKIVFENLKNNPDVEVMLCSTRAGKQSFDDLVIQIPFTSFIPDRLLILGFKVLDTYLSFQLKKITNKYSFDIMHVHDLYLLPAAIKVSEHRKIPLIAHVRDKIPKQIFANNFNFFTTKLLNQLLQYRNKIYVSALEKCIKVICISDFIKDKLIELGINPKKLVKIYNPINNLIPVTNNSQTISSEMFTFFMPGRVTIEKGYNLLVPAMLRTKEKNFIIKIAGDGPYLKPLVWEINKNRLQNRIVLLGKVNQNSVFKEYEKSNAVLFLPLYEEPFGRVALEATYVRKPIISISTGGIPEILRNYPAWIKLDDNSPEDLSTKIQYLVKRFKYYEDASKNFEFDLNQYSPENSSGNLIMLYKELMTSSK